MSYQYIRKNPVRRYLFALVAIISLATLSFAQAQAAGSPTGYFTGNAYSTYGFTNAGPLNAQLGKLTFIPCPCTGTNGQVKADSLPSLDAGAILHTQALYASVYTIRDATTAKVRNTAEIKGVVALGGLITADKVLAVASTTADATTIKSNGTDSVFMNLRIGGTLINANVAPNTQVNLAGFGHAILRETKKTGDGQTNGGINVNMLHIFVTTQNALGLPVGVEIIVGHADSGFVRAPIQVVYSGVSYVAFAKAVSPVLAVKLGKLAPSYIGCQGTGGHTNSNGIASLNIANIISTGAGATTASGGPVGGEAVAETTANVKNLNLFNGMIKADAVTAVATSTFNAGMGSSSTSGSGFVNLRVNGNPVLDVQANSKINLPGIGYVLLYEVKKSASSTAASTTVNMIHIYVTGSNSLGLPVGAEILVSSASSGVKPF